MKRIIGLIVLFSFGFFAKGQDIAVTAIPDTAVMLIGDQQNLYVSASVPSQTVADLKVFNDTLVKNILILGKPERDTTPLSDGRMTITDKYLITSYDSGTYIIPPFFAEIKNGDSIRRFYSDYIVLNVTRPDITPSDTTDVIFDVVPPFKAPLKFRDILPYIILAVVMLLIVWALAKFLPRNPLSRFIKPAPPADPAHIIAFRELDQLKEEELWQKGEIKEYYSRLSDILRRYIDGRYSIMSPELTTDETVRMLQKADVLKQDELSIIKNVLSLSDMVKFAKYQPQQEAHEESFNESVRFIEMTKAKEAEPEVNPGQKGGSNA